ncbi:STY0301 family protein [Aeromonas veronii]|uniref:STY0301 family protein n=1 Tax=Aeromonas veronii TaxID=654 RepID=UPI001D06F089|nr:STY0301 family protein [Aeromonas veronii]
MLLTTLALAASLQFDCPATIETRQQLLTPQQGWQAFTRNDDGKPDETLSHRLDNLALFDGDPAELAQLKPDNGDSDEIHYWSQLDSSLRPLYLICRYQNSAITLQQPLPVGISYCRVNQRDRYTLLGLVCRK